MLKKAAEVLSAVLIAAGTLSPAVFASSGRLEFVPPPSRKAVRHQFWDTIYGLERKRAAGGAVNGRDDLVDGIRADLSKLSRMQRTDTMLSFLRISFHYRGKTDDSLSEAERVVHEQKFMEEVRAFSDKAQREYVERKDPTYMRIFANVRSLAAVGREGLRLSQELSRVDPQNAVVQGNLAQDYLNVGELQSAVEASERAISLDPTDAAAFTTLASAKYSLKEYREAHDAASSALLIEPGDKVAYSIMKLTRERFEPVQGPRREQEDSMPVLAFDFRGRDSQAKDAVATLPAGAGGAGLAGGLAPAAFAESKALADQARTEIRKGEYRRAVDFSTRALAKNPRNAAALFRRAHAKYRLKAYNEALADTQEAMRVMGDKPSPILLLLHARVLNSLNRYEDALQAADRALAESPESSIQAKLLFQKSWALGGIERREDALHVLAQAARLDGAYIPYYQEALELPAESDWTLLFADELAAQTPAYAKPERRGKGGERLILLIAMTLVGGFLVALGLLQVVASRQAPAQPSVGLAPPDPGLIGGAFRVERKIGSGGMGVVYQALDVNLERPVAIKRMREEIGSDPRERERFLSEARTVAKLRHPNIVEIHSVVSDGSDVYLVFELIDGHTVSDYIRHYKRLEFGPALRILEGTAGALAFAHRHGVIHRDLKPSNIMITRDGAVKVMDFGVARHAKDSLASTAQSLTVSGTPPYMAPEQEQGRTCPASDVFALAVCFYEMTTGELPFNGTGGGMALAKVRKAYRPASTLAPGLPEGFDRVLAWGLEPDPDTRCPSPDKFVAALRGLGA